MRKLPERKDFVCASAENGAQGVAYMCRQFDNGRIFMPVTTPQQKIHKTKMFGGHQVTTELVGDYFDDVLTLHSFIALNMPLISCPHLTMNVSEGKVRCR